MNTTIIIKNNVKKLLTGLQKIAFDNIDLPNSKLAKKLGRSPQNTNAVTKALKKKLEKLEYTDEFLEDALYNPNKYLISSEELSTEIMKKMVGEYGRITVTTETINNDRIRLCVDPEWRDLLETPSEKMWRTYPFNIIVEVFGLKSEELTNTGYVNVDSEVQKELAVMWVNDVIKTCQIAEKRFDIVEMRYRYLRRLDDIGKKYNITGNRVRELLAKFLRQMRHPTRTKKLRFVTDVLFNTNGEVNFADIISKYEREMTMAEKEKQIVSKLSKDANVPLGEIYIEELDLSVRTYNCLKRYGIDNAEELVGVMTNKSEEECLNDIKNIGKKSYSEIKNKLISMGFLKSESFLKTE